MVLKLFLSSLFFTFCTTSFATVKVTALSGFSAAEGPLFGSSTVAQDTVYGGLGGNESACTTTDGVNPCNSCNGTTQECNTTRIYDSLQLKISFSSDAVNGRVLVTTDVDDGQEALTYSGVNTSDNFTKGNIVTITVLWSEICEEIFSGSSGCSGTLSTDLSSKIRVGFDDESNLDGELTGSGDDFVEIPIILAKMNATDTSLCTSGASASNPNIACNFIAYPGDEKVYIDELRTGCDFPNVASSESEIKKIRVLYNEGSYPTKATVNFSDLNISSTNQTCSNGTKLVETESNEIKGLENDKTYFFSLALVDQANNVGFFTTHSGDLTTKNSTATCFDGDQWKQNCHISTPTKVSGLIDDEFDCFITTATYGSPFRPKVEVFREFRNQFLKTNLLGRIIIESYYKISPPIALWIRNNPQAKPVIRALLWPYWFLSKILLFGTKSFALLLGLLFILLSFHYSKKHNRRV